jgi:hypothetical protein
MLASADVHSGTIDPTPLKSAGAGYCSQLTKSAKLSKSSSVLPLSSRSAAASSLEYTHCRLSLSPPHRHPDGKQGVEAAHQSSRK